MTCKEARRLGYKVTLLFLKNLRDVIASTVTTIFFRYYRARTVMAWLFIIV